MRSPGGAEHCSRGGKRDEDEIGDGVLFRLEKVKMGPSPFSWRLANDVVFNGVAAVTDGYAAVFLEGAGPGGNVGVPADLEGAVLDEGAVFTAADAAAGL